MEIQKLTDKQLLEKTETLAAREREITLSVLHHLAEIQRRRLFSARGFSSLFTYCVGALKYSEGAAHRRIQAMWALCENPELEQSIESGNLSLTNLASAQSHFANQKRAGKPLAQERKREILKSLENKSKREVEKTLLGEIQAHVGHTDGHAVGPFAEQAAEAGRIVDTFKLTSPEKLEFKSVEVSPDLLDQLRGLLAHKYPGISEAKMVELALTEWIQKLDPAKRIVRRKVIVDLNANEAGIPSEAESTANAARCAGNAKEEVAEQERHAANPKQAIARKPQQRQPPQQQPPPRKLPESRAEVRRMVWRLAESKCELCHSKYALQIDHRLPRAKGGGDNLENLRLLCRNCNQREAIEKLGMEKMDRYINRAL